MARLDRYAWVALTSAAGAAALVAALPSAISDTGGRDPALDVRAAGGAGGGRAISDTGGRDPASDVRGAGGAGDGRAISDTGGRDPAPDLRAPPGWPAEVRVAVVGPATADAMRRAGIEPDLVPVTATAADLAAAFPPAPASARVLAPLAELAGDDLVAGLRARGWQVDRVDAYRLADLPPPAPGAGPAEGLVGADAVAFTSPSTVDRFCDRFGPTLVPPVVACIGPRTAERARQRGLAGIVTAADHTAPGLVAALIAALS